MRQAIDPAVLLIRARVHLSAGRFFVALDLCGQVEHWISENPGTLDTERLRAALAPVMRQAEEETARALEEALPAAQRLRKTG